MKINAVLSATTYTEFGDPKALQSVNQAITTAGGTFNFLRLSASAPGGDQMNIKRLSDITPHTDAQALLDDITAFKKAAQSAQNLGEYDLPEVTWYQIQYYMFNKRYIETSDSGYATLKDPEQGYWWYDPTLTSRPEPPPPPSDEPTKELNAILYANIGGSVSITAEQLKATGLIVNKAQTGKSVAIGSVNNMLGLLAKEATLSNYVEGGELKLTWVQIQYYLAKAHEANARGTKPGVLTDHASALAGLKGMGWDPAKFPAGVKIDI